MRGAVSPDCPYHEKMQLTQADIIEYKELVKAKIGTDLSDAEALEDALSLIRFVDLVRKLPNSQ